MTDEQINAICDGMIYQPWGIGSRRQDAIAFARAILAASGMQGMEAPSVVAVEATDKITIRYERSGRCFWHMGCKAQRHAPPMRIDGDDSENRRLVLRCVACGESGYFPFGGVGDVRCVRLPAATSPNEGGNAE
jgi:Ni,Fe-hydrogenase I small subunit